MGVIRALLCVCIISLSGCAATNSGSQQDGIRMRQTSRGVLIQSSNKILFDTGKADIKPSGQAFLDQVANVLLTKSSSRVVVEGHTDNVGSPALNQELSELRALVVMKALIDRHVPKARITANGYGMNRPIATNDTEEGRQLNRRTDILLLGEKEDNLKDTPFNDFLKSVSKLWQ